eukprot:1156469-Pelagomonas_calceolata.AAC.4
MPAHTSALKHGQPSILPLQVVSYKNTFTSEFKNWREITCTDGIVIQQKDNSSPLVGSAFYKPSRDTTQSSQQQQVYINPNGHGPTNTINRAEPVGILVALQQGHTAIASDSTSCLSQISKQTFNPMRMRTHFHWHAELIQASSNALEHSPHPVHSYKVKTHSGNEGADACARAAALTDTVEIALPDPFHNVSWFFEVLTSTQC